MANSNEPHSFPQVTIGDGVTERGPALLHSIATQASSVHEINGLIAKHIRRLHTWLTFPVVLLIIIMARWILDVMISFSAALGSFGEEDCYTKEGSVKTTDDHPNSAGAQAARPGLKAITAENMADRAPASLQTDYVLILREIDIADGLVHRVTLNQCQVSKLVNLRARYVRIREGLTLTVNKHRIRIFQTIHGREVVYAYCKLAIPRVNTFEKFTRAQAHASSFELDAVWKPFRQLPETDGYIVIVPASDSISYSNHVTRICHNWRAIATASSRLT